jgi:hypothetical protein
VAADLAWDFREKDPINMSTMKLKMVRQAYEDNFVQNICVMSEKSTDKGQSHRRSRSLGFKN